MSSLTPLQQAFVNQFQGGFPLARRPFSVVAARLGTTDATLLLAIEDLLNTGLISRFGPLFDAERLGGGLTLAALSAPSDRFQAVADVVNACPEVAHNYRREHHLNMWFVVAADSRDKVAGTLDAIERDTGLQVLSFPKLREFYLGLRLRIDAGGEVRTVPWDHSATSTPHGLDALDRALVRATQSGLPLVPEPYAEIARGLGCVPPEVIQRMRGMLASGVVRRVGAVPNHYRLGLRSNGMSVWDVPNERVEEFGRRIGQLDFVSHCYERPRHRKLWPYNLFAMVHGRTRSEVDTKVAIIAGLLGRDCRCHDVLISTAILKKTGLRLAA